MDESDQIIHSTTGGTQVVIMPEAEFEAIERKLKEHGIEDLELWLQKSGSE